MAVRTVPSSAPLVVFVSSTMDANMTPARDACFSLLSRPPFTPWIFEHTPASAKSARASYLDGLASSDIVVWLAGAKTSPAVIEEVEAALRHDKDLLGFLMPAEDRDAQTQALIDTVRAKAKTSDVADVEDLLVQVSQSLNGLLVDAYRRRGTTVTEAGIQQLLGGLRGLAVSRWMGAGVSALKAFELFEDDTVGAIPECINPLQVLVGEVGSGKTLAAIRFLQRAAKHALGDESAPTPVWLDATAIDHVQVDADRQAERLGGIPNGCLAVVIDGLDERGGDGDARILAEARALAYGRRGSRVFLTTRSMVGLTVTDQERAAVPEMSSTEAVEIINRAFDLELKSWSADRWATPVRDAVKRPLFALLMGRHLSQNGGVVGDPGQLVDELILAALGRGQVDRLAVNRTLVLLAKKSIDADGRPVHASDLGDRTIVAETIRTRLVNESEGSLAFSLPIIRDWFGAQCLLTGVESPARLAVSEQQLERWRWALSVAISTLPRANVNDLLATIARHSPAFASQLIDRSASGSHGQEARPIALPGALELGGCIRLATESFLEGVGEPLSWVVGPCLDGHIPPLEVSLSDSWFSARWLDDSIGTAAPNVLELQPFGPDLPWLSTHGGQASVEPVWPWRFAFDGMRGRLLDRMKAAPFYVAGGAIEREVAWATAVEMTRRDVLFHPLPAEPLRVRLAENPAMDLIKIGQRIYPLLALRAELAKGLTVVTCPYPDRDRDLGGLIWDGFSPDQLLDRTRQVYAAAIEIYQEWTDTLFARLKPRLNHAQLLPARLTGTLQLATGDDSYGPGGLDYWLEPLAAGSHNEVSIEIGTINREESWERLEALSETIRRLRPMSGWVRPFVQGTSMRDLFSHMPAMAIAWHWLGDDLASVGWLSNRTSLGWF